MYFVYSVLFGAWIVLMLPYFLYNARVNKKYLPRIKERMGFLPDSLKSDGRRTIWFHSCSVGETLSLQPLAHALSEQFPDCRFVFSTITRTGRKIAEERFAKYGEGNTFYFPIDLPLFAKRVLNHVRPNMLITIDTEIWPNVLHECRMRDIPIVMANGRVSAQSFQYYRWLVPLLGPVLSNYAAFVMKDKEDAARLQTMGARPSRITISGNIKYDRDTVEKGVSAGQMAAIAASFGLKADTTGRANGPIIVAGSTHDGEEELLFEVLKRLRAIPDLSQTRLLLAPRHPERFGAAAALAARSGLTVARRTAGQPNTNAEVLVLDTLGELAAAYGFATVAFVGGTLIPFGGQSIMEPALHGKAIVIGPSMDNFPSIIDDFVELEAIWQIPATTEDKQAQVDQLTEAFTKLLTGQAARETMGERALSIFAKSKGATKFTVERIAEVLGHDKQE